MREVAAEQEAAQPEPAPARASPKQGGPIGFILRSNPIGSFLNGLLNHQPTSNKYDMLWDLLHISRTEAGAVRDSKYDPVYEVLQSAAVEVNIHIAALLNLTSGIKHMDGHFEYGRKVVSPVLLCLLYAI